MKSVVHVAVLALCLGRLGASSTPAAARRDPSPGDSILAEWFVAADTKFLDAPAEAAGALRELSGKLELACGGKSDDQGAFASCAIQELLAGGQLHPTADPADPMHNSVSQAVVSGDSSCGGLVATVLAVTDRFGEPFEALVFRDHVVLALRESKGIAFETLDHGRKISELELSRRPMPPSGKPVRVRAAGYRAYYLDNLAARLAAVGDTVAAEKAIQSALRLSPRVGRFHYNYGTLLLNMGRNRDSADHLDSAIRYGWDDADAWTNRGIALSRLGRKGAARTSFRKALKLDPAHRGAQTSLAALDAGGAP